MPAASSPAVQLVRRERADEPAPVLDDSQRRVVEHRGGPLLALAGPGTGKTTTLVEAVVHRVEHGGLDPEQILVLTFSRRAAVALRDRIARRLGRTVREPLARTFHSYAFGLLRRESVQSGEPTPRLISGAEQDLLIRDMLRGDVEELGAGYWPGRLQQALLTRGFARELRELLMRAVERGLSPDDLDAIGRQRGRDDWIAAARFAHQYSGVTALRKPPSYDQAELVRSASGLLRDDPELLAGERDTRGFIVVDEYQDSDPAQEELLGLLAGGGRDLLVVGDPDQSIYGFRGAEVDGIRRFPERFRNADGTEAAVYALTTSRRCGPDLLSATRRVAMRLGGPHTHRHLHAADPEQAGRASVHVLGSANQEASFIAAHLREAHLKRDVPWSSMAVLVRAATTIPVLRRALHGAGVPTSVQLEEVPLVEQPAVRALLTIVELAAGERTLDADCAFDLVTGVFGGADPLALRRLRQELRRHELMSGGGRASSELIVEAIEQPVTLAPLDDDAVAPAARIAHLISAGRNAAVEPGATAEDVLWAVWSASGVSQRWARQALGDGPSGQRADRDLDAVLALFDAAARYVDRMPGAGPEGFLEHIRGQQIPSDSLGASARHAPSTDAVSIVTAHAAKGLEWDVVAVAGVQEGTWPDLRDRGSLLGTEELVDLVADRDPSPVTRASARLAEERRLFYVALTRARSELVVTAVSNEDEQPSRFLDDLDPLPADAPPDRPVEGPRRGLDLPSLVAELRQVACDQTEAPPRRHAAAAHLARLSAEGVRQADPHQWYGLRELSTEAALVDDGAQIRVSPSKIDEFNRCELRWLLKSCGATDSDMTRAGLGSLVHDLAEGAVTNSWSEEELLDELDRAWPRIDVGEGWAAEREYARAQEMVRLLARWLKENPRRLVGVELDFDATIGRARLVGRVDRLDADADGRLVVVDYKTGKNAPTATEVDEHAQLAVYQVAVESGAFDDASGGERRSGGASLVQLGKASKGRAKEQRQPPLSDSEDPRWGLRLVEETAEGMAQQVFHARRGAWCGFCPARPSCPVFPEGAQVTP
ncbi:ATP-dependent helicase [Actinobacteria bacterium YIM 96077]|uniref:DNA 3'-5' helicase n=1 Tax=Phytoactinopolyspora halophila TaxID=1981511 RepID=A0A329R4F8_9ACTN|nr:ATP-dependent DNA helicase [Phytoactinopolyspora halophila]AYY11950.1 ATP-dependent helicase [Actinobacteria bacterium YIM 96077]RAW18816.1 ATP-dependent helicase [Phytoactinopolyspora halophila]